MNRAPAPFMWAAVRASHSRRRPFKGSCRLDASSSRSGPALTKDSPPPRPPRPPRPLRGTLTSAPRIPPATLSAAFCGCSEPPTSPRCFLPSAGKCVNISPFPFFLPLRGCMAVNFSLPRALKGRWLAPQISWEGDPGFSAEMVIIGTI